MTGFSGTSAPRCAGTGSNDPVCAAPFASMWLDPRGVVRACCINHMHPLGDISQERLIDIWRGPRAQQLRSRVAAGDLGLGCEDCAHDLRTGNAATAMLSNFVHLHPVAVDPPWPLQLELSLSNSCNLQCIQCDGDLSSSIRIHREGRRPLPKVYGEEFFEDLVQFLPHLRRVVFLGGEPFLAAESLRVMEMLVDRGLRPECVTVTNGTHWNDRIERIVRSLPMHVSVSIDAIRPETHQSVRVGVDQRRLLANIERLRSAARDTGNGFQFSSCLMLPTWREFGELLEYADSLDVTVYVKRVMSPARLSLHHCPPHELEAIVGELEDQDGHWRRRLQRNRPVWERELESLRALVRQRRARSPAVPVSLSPSSERERSQRRNRARLIAQGAGDERGVLDVKADSSYTIVEILPPTDTWGIDLRPLVGRRLEELPLALEQHFGPLVSSELDRPGEVMELRRLRYGSDGAGTVLTAVLADDDDGPLWLMSVRPA